MDQEKNLSFISMLEPVGGFFYQNKGVQSSVHGPEIKSTIYLHAKASRGCS
jgi:hypothetical protein